MSAPQKHWVEELFRPKFGYTFDQILEDPTLKVKKQDDEAEEDAKPKGPSVYEQVARRVSPLDVSAIKNVYERVWLMSHLEEEEKRKKECAEEERLSSETKQRNKGKKVTRDAQTSTSDIEEHAPLDIHNPTIWNSKEIEVLRSVFQTANEQNSRLRAQLQESQDHCETLEKKHNKQSAVLEKRTTKLKEAFKANDRLDVMCKSLKAQVDTAENKLEDLCEQIKEMKQERTKMLEEMHELRVIGDHDRLDRKKAELELQCQTRETIRQDRIKQASIKSMYDEDIQFLQTTVEELSQELDKEKGDHTRTRRALDHLRQHFSSQDTEESSAQEELHQWSY